MSTLGRSARGAIRTDRRPLSVVIPTWNGGERFGELLRVLDAQELDGDGFELVVVDSGSTDGTRERAIAAGAFVLAIDQRNFQHGRTRNQAIARSAGERVVRAPL